MRFHDIVIKIECLDPQSEPQARARLERWLSTFGHTACSHGFEFIEVSKLDTATDKKLKRLEESEPTTLTQRVDP